MFSFMRQAVRDFKHTGAVWPSSPQLAKVMTRSLRGAAGSRRVLEVGPGTGVFTRDVIEHLRSGDEFDIVEINPAFCRHLERHVLPRGKNGPVVRLHCSPIESAAIEGPYDFIICGLPFNNFPPAMVRSIFRRLISLLREGGELAYFEYAGVRVMKAPLVGPNGRRRLREISRVGKALRRKHGGRRELVLGNIPPALAVRLKRSGA